MVEDEQSQTSTVIEWRTFLKKEKTREKKSAASQGKKSGEEKLIEK